MKKESEKSKRRGIDRVIQREPVDHAKSGKMDWTSKGDWKKKMTTNK